MMRLHALAQNVARQRLCMILTDATHFWMPAYELLKPPFIFKELRQVFGRAEFPGHVACRPKAVVPVSQCCIEGTFERLNHPGNVKFPLPEKVTLIGGKHQARFGDLTLNIDTVSRKLRLHAGDHWTAVEIKAPAILLQLLAQSTCDLGNMARRRTFIDQTLVAGSGGTHAERHYSLRFNLRSQRAHL